MAAVSSSSNATKAATPSPSIDDIATLSPEYRFPQLTPAEASVWANNYLERSRFYRDNGIVPIVTDKPAHEPRLALTLWTRLSARDDAALAAANDGMRFAIGDAQSLVAWCLNQCGQHMAALAQYQRVADNQYYPADVKGNALRAAARMVLNGVGGLPIDEPLAIKWLERAGKMVPEGFKEAADVLLWSRDCYDPIRAISAYELATSAGAVSSRFELAKMYALGIGITPDRARAFAVLALTKPGALLSGPTAHWAAALSYPCTHEKWLPNTIIEQQAQDKETINADAQYTFGMAHLQGTNECKKSVDEAKVWLTLAAKNGSHHAKAQLLLLDPYGENGIRMITKEGMMTKKGGTIPTWKNRQWILDQSLLSYYKKKGDPTPIRSLPLYQLRVKVATEKQCSKPFAFACHHLLDSRVFYVVAPSAAERDAWVAAISAARDLCTWGKKEWGVIAELGGTAAEVADRGIELALAKLGGSDAAFAQVMVQPQLSVSSSSESKSRSRPVSPASSRPASPTRSRPESPLPSSSPSLSPSSSIGSSSSAPASRTGSVSISIGTTTTQMNTPPKCSNECAKNATVRCENCAEDFCNICDAMLHKRAATAQHVRTPLNATSLTNKGSGQQEKAATAA